ncbi:39S ribosomal protein-like protein L33 [Teratosphaeria destructans]|uniref:39S ribosomal protein-like protein L33 n=1 Tax=Teratosphaeria destructans TaxID=418781 RepID=A0A9W7VY09_9PEZI|nr:39S ribosomal protein-like protein L33 [Teratosphaeria destructans]
MTGYYKTFSRPRTHRPLSMLKYDPVGTSCHACDKTMGALLTTPPVKKKVLFLEQKRGNK